MENEPIGNQLDSSIESSILANKFVQKQYGSRVNTRDEEKQHKTAMRQRNTQMDELLFGEAVGTATSLGFSSRLVNRGESSNTAGGTFSITAKSV